MSSKIEPSGFTNETYDRLFKAIFGRENQQSKQWRLELYNALRGTTKHFKKTANRCIIISGMLPE